MKYFNDTWKVIDTYYRSNNLFLTKHHIESWNDFVINKVINTIKVLNPFIVLKEEYEIRVYVGNESGEEIFIDKPTIYEDKTQRPLFPNEARLRDLTYQTNVYANILIVYFKNNVLVNKKILERTKIGAIPIMIHSKLCCLNGCSFDVLKEMGECPFDQGGYFIIDGKEKVIVAQERIALNKLFINKSKNEKFIYEALVRSTSELNPLFPKTVRIYIESKTNAIILTCPNIKNTVPIFILFKALGIESDKEILKYILYDIEQKNVDVYLDFLRYSIVDATKYQIYTQEEAYNFIKNHVEYTDIVKVQYTLMYDLFPNVGIGFRNKAMFLGHLINRLVKTYLGILSESDRDNYVYKRVDISGFLIGNLFRDYYNQFRNNIRSRIDNQYLTGPWKNTGDISNLVNKANLYLIFDSNIIENGFRKSLKGSWGKSMVEDGNGDNVKEGIVQDLSRISYMGYMSHLRRVNTPMDPTAKIVAPHRLHPSQWGIMCPIESPDGASIGLLKHLAILTHVTFESGTEVIMDLLKKLNVLFLEEIDIEYVSISTKVLINSNWVGVTDDPPYLFKFFKLLKRNGYIDKYISISWDIYNHELNISTEACRCTRPVYVVHEKKLLIEDYIDGIDKLNWDDLIGKPKSLPSNISSLNIDSLISKQSPIEYIDVDETNNSLIAMTPADINKYTTYCEIHPSVLFGVVSQNIPLLNHNQAPRNIFFGAQAKQAIGTFATNFNHRIDTMSYVLHYPQKQLVTTRYKEYQGNNILTGGENLIVAICTWMGWNQEDSIIVNKSAIERGMFNMTYFKSFVDTESENPREGEKIVFMNPQKVRDIESIKDVKYSETLDENGFPLINKYIHENEAILGKVLLKTEMTEDGNDILGAFLGNKQAKELAYDKSSICDKTISGIVDKLFVYHNADTTRTCKMRLRKVRIVELGDKMASTHGQKGVCGMILSAVDMPYNKDGIVPDIVINPHCIPSRMTIGHLLETILAKTGVNEGCMIDATPFNNNDYKSIYELLETKYGLEKYGNEILYNGQTGQQIQTEIFFGPTYYQRLKHMVSDKLNYRNTGPKTLLTRQPTKGRGNQGGLRIGEMENISLQAHGIGAFLKESMFERSDKYTVYTDKTTGSIVNKKNSNSVKVNIPYASKLFLQELSGLGVKPQLVFDKIDEEEVYYGEADARNIGINVDSDDD